MRRQVRPSPKRDLEEAERETSANKRSKVVISDDQGKFEKVDAVKVKTCSSFSMDYEAPFACPASNHHQDQNTTEPPVNSNSSVKSQNNEEMSSKTNGTAESTAKNPGVTQNGSLDEISTKSVSANSEANSELASSTPETTQNTSGEDHLLAENKSMPVLSAENLEVHNSESTDSFQSEGFEAFKCTSQLESKESLPSSSQEPEKVMEEEKSAISSLTKVFDLDSLMISHLEVMQLEGHPDVVYSVAAEGDLLLSSSGDTTVRVWNLVDKSMVCNFSGHKDSVTSVYLLTQSQSDSLKAKLKVSDDVSRIAITGSLDCNIKLWSVFEGKELASIYSFNGITCLGYMESQSLVVIGTEGGKLELWDVCNAQATQSMKAHEDSISDLKVHDPNIYTVSSDGVVKVWLFEDEELYPVYTRKRKEKALDNTLGPSHWKSVATSDNILYLGDNTKNVKVLDSVAGRLRSFKNQLEQEGVCECVTVDQDILLSTFYEPTQEVGGINVWKIPDMSYVCTLTGDVQDVCCLAVVRKQGLLRIISGGHQLLVWDFDFTRPSNKGSEDPFTAVKLETLGREIAESSPQSKKTEILNKSTDSVSNEETKNSWCTMM